MCLDCGFECRLYNQFREVLVPVNGTNVRCNVLYFDRKSSNYKKVSLELPITATVEMLKLLVLHYKYPNQRNL